MVILVLIDCDCPVESLVKSIVDGGRRDSLSGNL